MGRGIRAERSLIISCSLDLLLPYPNPPPPPVPPRPSSSKLQSLPKKNSSQKNVFCYDKTAALSSVSVFLKVCVCVWQVPPPSLGHDMAQLLESGQAADVRFKVEEEELAAHKFILTARSPVFRSVAAALFILL